MIPLSDSPVSHEPPRFRKALPKSESSSSSKGTFSSLKENKKTKALSPSLKEEAMQAICAALYAERGKEQIEENLLYSISSCTASQEISLEAKPNLSSTLLEALQTIDQKGIQQTTLILGASSSSSLFEGTKITITEYSTAPKIFNIQISAQGEALAFFEAQAQSLLHSLRSSTDLFSVHRLEVDTESSSEFHREKREQKEYTKEREKEKQR